jgi:hypothetical protein
MKVFVEAGDKKVFAGAIEWPGWARSGKTEEQALQALLDYAPRYARSTGESLTRLNPPADVRGLKVLARLRGGSGTDFGVPHVVGDFDREPVSAAQLEKLMERLRAAWKAFDAAADQARGKTLAKGPRGGGRTLAKIREHVIEADRAYIDALGARSPRGPADWTTVQEAFIEALHAKVRGELPEVGPRGGERWPARYAVRRSAWHALDHAWEIEDRS